MDVVGWPEIFRGSDAVRAGLVTWARLHGPGFARVYPDTWVARDMLPLDVRGRCRAVFRWTRGRGAIAGWAAAELSGASCAPRGVPVEVAMPVRSRAPDGVRIRRESLHAGEIEWRHGVRVTTPLRTVFDLARLPDETAAVVAVDALARVHGFHPDLLLNFAVRYAGLRGVGRTAHHEPGEFAIAHVVCHSAGIQSCGTQDGVRFSPNARIPSWPSAEAK